MKNFIKILTGLILCGLLYAQEFEKITDVNATVDSKDKITVTVDLTGPTNYYLFKISNPPRLVVEFTSAMVEAKNKEIDLKGSFINKLRVGQYKDEPIKIARLVFDLSSEDVFYDALAAGNRIIIAVSSKSELAKAMPPEPTYRKEELKKKTVKKKETIERNVPDEDHAKKVEAITASGEDVKSEAAAEEPSDVSEISTVGGALQISRKIISINFYQSDIRTILRAIAEQTGLNIIYGPDVQGNITLKLHNVTFDDALKIILKMSGLIVEREADNIIRVITPEALKTERSKSVQFTRVLPLKYTRASDIQKQLTAIKVEGVSATIGEDTLTNSIVLTTSPDGIAKYQELINIFDVRPRQVLIEATMMEVDYSDSLDLGIAWQLRDFNVLNKNANNLLQGSIQNNPAATPVSGSQLPALNTASVGLSFAIGGLINSNQFSVLIDALQKKNKAKTLSKPKIVAMNNEKAHIMSGDQVPYTNTTVTTSGSTQSTEFTNVGIQLDVTPTIHSDEYVTLEVTPKVSSYQMSTAGPIITTREAQTKIMVKSNDTVVIGGLIKESDLSAIDQMPILGDLPIIGYLFKRQQQTKDRVELLVFIRPVILD
ncbi:MAG: hypothetical protein COT16_02900 [Elusimicrobia bacterium CG08_land_8_20_14_0_20_44_26]|nr:MAG: hypothetical protein COT16_02900 [Elusimicrobia bacterium CG08_land_8_20_14_0_20_44_26]